MIIINLKESATDYADCVLVKCILHKSSHHWDTQCPGVLRESHGVVKFFSQCLCVSVV